MTIQDGLMTNSLRKQETIQVARCLILNIYFFQRYEVPDLKIKRLQAVHPTHLSSGFGFYSHADPGDACTAEELPGSRCRFWATIKKIT